MNLKTLAQQLGVSETTVSRALNGYPEVSDHTRERVFAAAQKYGYRPNPMARGLASGRTNVIGMIQPLIASEFGDPMLMQIVCGMLDELETRQMELMMVPVAPMREFKTYQQIVKMRRVDGLIISQTRHDDERINFLKLENFPFVAFGRTSTSHSHAWLDLDHHAGMRLAVEHLLSYGHTEIGLINAPLTLNCARQRFESFQQSLMHAGITLNPNYCVNSCDGQQAAYNGMCKLLQTAPTLTAVIVDTPQAGVGAMRALIDAGVKIGGQISIIIWGGLDETFGDYSITTIAHPNPMEIGAKLVEMLTARQAGTSADKLQMLWQPVLVHGNTVRKHQTHTHY